MKKALLFIRHAISYFLLLFGIGLGTYVFLRILAKDDDVIAKAKAQKNAHPDKDTTYVKLVDVPFALGHSTQTNSAKDQTTEPAKQTNPLNPSTDIVPSPTGRGPRGGVEAIDTTFGPQTKPLLATLEPTEIGTKLAAQTNAKLEDLQRRSYQNKSTGMGLSLFLLFSIVLIGLAFFTRNPENAHASMKDVNPRELDELFERYATRIKEIRNPRKILRLKNSMAYHFYFLKNNNLISPDNLNKTMEVLLALLKDSTLTEPNNVSDEDLKKPDWFYKKLVALYPSFGNTMQQPRDNDLLMLLLKLNADIS